MLSYSLSFIKPINSVIEPNNTYYIGTMGPGQAISVLTENKITTGGIYNEGGLYDYADVFQLPENWTYKPSPLFSNPLQVILTSPPYVKEGRYKIGIVLVDDGFREKLENYTFYVLINITYDIFSVSLDSLHYSVGVKQPLYLNLHIKNKGDVGDIYIVEAISENNYIYKEYFIPARSTKDVTLDLRYLSRGKKHIVIHVWPKSSDMLTSEYLVDVDVKGSFKSDFSALTKGIIVIFPHEDIIYTFLSMFSGLVH